MKRVVTFVLFLFVLLVACTAAPTATPAPTNTPLPTATPQPTNTSLPTSTPTAVASPTAHKPEATSTPVDQSTRGKQVLFASFAKGEPLDAGSEQKWAGIPQIGDIIDYPADPTDQSKTAARYTATKPENNQSFDSNPNNYWIISYHKYINEKNLPISAIETEVYIPSDHWGYTAGFSNLSAHGQNDGKDVIWFGIRKPYKGQIDFGWRNDATGENRTTVLNLGDIEELKNLSDLRDKWIKFRIEIDNSNKRIRFLVNGRILGEVNDVVFNVRDWHDGLLPSVSKLEDLWVNRGDFIYNRNSAHEISK